MGTVRNKVGETHTILYFVLMIHGVHRVGLKIVPCYSVRFNVLNSYKIIFSVNISHIPLVSHLPTKDPIVHISQNWTSLFLPFTIVIQPSSVGTRLPGGTLFDTESNPDLQRRLESNEEYHPRPLIYRDDGEIVRRDSKRRYRTTPRVEFLYPLFSVPPTHYKRYDQM